MSKKRLSFFIVRLLSCIVLANAAPAEALEANANIVDAPDAIMQLDERLGAKQYAEALTVIDAYLKIHPDFTQFYLQKGYVQFRLKQYDQALLSLSHCLKAGYAGMGAKAVDSLNSEVWLYTGHCKLAKGDKRRCKASF